MTTYDKYDRSVTEEIHAELEDKFLKILSQPDVVIPAEDIPEDGVLTEEQRALLQTILESEMQTPEEIERDAKIMAHNAEVQRKRDERLARRATKNTSRRRR